MSAPSSSLGNRSHGFPFRKRERTRPILSQRGAKSKVLRTFPISRMGALNQMLYETEGVQMLWISSVTGPLISPKLKGWKLHGCPNWSGDQPGSPPTTWPSSSTCATCPESSEPELWRSETKGDNAVLFLAGHPVNKRQQQSSAIYIYIIYIIYIYMINRMASKTWIGDN